MSLPDELHRMHLETIVAEIGESISQVIAGEGVTGLVFALCIADSTPGGFIAYSTDGHPADVARVLEDVARCIKLSAIGRHP